MPMSERDLQANEEVDNVYQDVHIWMSGPRPDNGPDVASHSLADPHMHDKVDMEEFLGPHSDRHKEMLSLDSESEVKYDSNN